MDYARTLIFIVDPLSIPNVRCLLSANTLQEYQAADRPANDSYGSVIDRLSNSNVDLHSRNLAFVVTKADAVNELFPNDPLNCSSPEVRSWLYDHGADELVRRVELDFGEDNVTYFAIDSMSHAMDNQEYSPLNVAEWAVAHAGGTLGFMHTSPVIEDEASPTTTDTNGSSDADSPTTNSTD